MNPIKTIKSNSPKALGYFLDYYTNEYPYKINEDFESLPFDFQLGVYICFFDHINSDIQLYSANRDALTEAVIEAFETYEEYLFLDS